MAVATTCEVFLRPMVPDDLDAVVEVERTSNRTPWSEGLLRRELDHDWSTILLAVERTSLDRGCVDERVIGFVVYWLVHDEVHVLNVATHSAFRRRGVARSLLVEAEARGTAHGAVLSTLEVRRSNDPAIALYSQLGYRQVGVRPRYYVDNQEDALVMVKDLPRPV